MHHLALVLFVRPSKANCCELSDNYVPLALICPQNYGVLSTTLIKATVAQAYPLVIRPFPEGNERLSRMMSSAVLLRCGYDFFRDISISSVIARENYRYYKAMCDILRPENGGDMTYFMEYYLDLLARAVDLQKERLRRKEEDALTRERALARESLKATAVSPPAPQGEPSAAAPEEAIAESDAPSDERSAIDSFLATVDKLKHSQNPKTRRLPALVFPRTSVYVSPYLAWSV